MVTTIGLDYEGLKKVRIASLRGGTFESEFGEVAKSRISILGLEKTVHGVMKSRAISPG